MLLRILYALIFSIIFVLILLGRTETVLFWRKQFGMEIEQDFRRKNYKEDLIFGAICSIVIFVFFIFFAKM